MRILLIDNYDSFTYNLVQLISKFTNDIIIKRNDQFTLEDVIDINPNRIVISPGPGNPFDSQMSLKVVNTFYEKLPILGVCLGHQCIAVSFGGKVIRSKTPRHGKVIKVFHNTENIFREIPNEFKVTLYHSLVIDKDSLPECLEITAWSEDEVIMGIKHRAYNVQGVQFHPEAILTQYGDKLIENWLLEQ